jgi:hypothetical protein
MQPLVAYVWNFAWTILVIFLLNYVLALGTRDLLYLVLPIGPPTMPRIRTAVEGGVSAAVLFRRIIFWIAFAVVVVPNFVFLMPIAEFIVVSYFFFKAAEKNKLSHRLLALSCGAVLAAVAIFFVYGQPVLLRIDRQFSVDLWIYNASNSLIDTLIYAGRRIGADTAGIERLETLVPLVQKNIFALLFLSMYLLSGVTLTKLGRMILPGTSYKAPVYYKIAPVREFALIAVAGLAAAHFLHEPQIAFAVAGVYYLWGVNALIYMLRGGHWALNMFIAAAGALNPWTMTALIALGAADNLLDIRRLAAVLFREKREGI